MNPSLAVVLSPVSILTHCEASQSPQVSSADQPCYPSLTPRARDAAYVRRFNAGEESAFTEIMRLHRSKLFAVVLSVIRDPYDAEELVQDTFVRAHRSLAAFRGDSSLATWLYQIATNLARNRYWYFRRRQRHNACSLDTVGDGENASPLSGMIADVSPNPVQEACQGEFASTVRACLRRLSPDQRDILDMRCIRDMSYEEIGSFLGVRAGTVKSRISRARNNLRLLLAESFPEPEPAVAEYCCWFEPTRATSRSPMVAP